MIDSRSCVYIYALVDPRSPDDIRYIGKSFDVNKRLKGHLSKDSLKTQSHKNNWIKSLLGGGVRPGIMEIESCPISGWEQREIYWIDYYKSKGHRLTNGTDGGGGSSGYKPSLETIERLKKSHTGIKQPIETINKRILSNTGKKRSAESRERISNSLMGRRLSGESRDKIRRANLGKKHPNRPRLSKESIERMRVSHLGKKHSLETIEKMRLSHINNPKRVDGMRIVSQKNTGRKMSKEAIAKRVESRKINRANKRPSIGENK